ncbi:MAG: hypothetical protein F4139_06700 [Gemmatimonadetes bacterium]|nr:hypothetical protein [Gemmatimonadota bacterium]MYH52625.1 hypothetical protein [Gemmatimonadota bacterium]MYK67643.1 hypothetical protein [Gemmatimonadota bacterium]
MVTCGSVRVRGSRRRVRCPGAVPALMAMLSLCASPGGVVRAQEPERQAETFDVTVQVRDAESDAPLLGALIELSGVSRRHVTGVRGEVTLKIPAGHYTFTAHKGGYATLRGDFGVIGPSELTVVMHELGDVDTSIPGRLLVRVAEFGSGRLIEGAAVALSERQGGLTDGSGWVEFSDVDGPVAEVTVEMLGYRKRTEPVTLHEGRTTVVEVAMSIDAVVLAPLEVEVRSGFLEAHGVYWRMDHGHAMHVFDSEDLIERGGVPYLTQAFTRIPNLHVLGDSILGRRRCRIAVYWDGVPTEFGDQIVRPIPGGLDFLAPEEIELVEIYTGLRTPLRFSRWPGDSNDCGAIAVWSKRRADRSR